MMRSPRATGLLFALGFGLLSIPAAPAAEAAADAAPATKPRPGLEIARELSPACARVLLWTKRHEGEAPENDALAAALVNDRPFRVGGFWWSDNEVLIADPVLPDHFIRRIEVETSDGVRRFPAEISARFVHARLALVKVLGTPSAPSSNKPLVFAPAPPDAELAKLRVAAYARYAGQWRLTVSGGPSRAVLSENAPPAVGGQEEGLLVDPEGRPVGYAASSRGDEQTLDLGAGGDGAPWRGADLVTARKLGVEELANTYEKLGERLAASLPEVRFAFRQELEDGEGEGGGYRASDDSMSGETPELRVVGWRVGPQRLLVPCQLDRNLIGKIEDIAVTLPDGAVLPAVFAGTLREFEGVYVDVEGDWPGAPLFTVAAPDDEQALAETGAVKASNEQRDEGVRGNAPATRRMVEGELFIRWSVDFATGRRRTLPSYDRPRGVIESFRDFPFVWTFTNETAGALAYGLDGALLAAAIAPRVPSTGDGDDYQLEKAESFRPIGWLVARLARPDAIDAAVVPVADDEARRLVSFGVEVQGLTREVAIWFGAEAATRGGRIGLLVTHVYPDSSAERAGIREKDILLRVKIPDRREPFDLALDEPFPWFNQSTIDFDSMPPERVAMILDRIPPPWPPRENPLVNLLTAVGVGRAVTLDYFRDGAVHQTTFDTEKGPADFTSAPKYRSRALGLTVKPVTFEVARYHHRPADGGAVIVHQTTPGGKAQVSGMRKYHLITRVNGQPVTDLEDFRRKTTALEDGSARVVEFTLEDMGRTRLVKIEMAEQP